MSTTRPQRGPGCPQASPQLWAPVHAPDTRPAFSRSEHNGSRGPARQTRQSWRCPRGPHLWTSLWVSGYAVCASSVRMRALHTGGQPVDNRWTTHRRPGERAGVSCGGAVRDGSASTTPSSRCAAASTRRTQPFYPVDLRRRAPSTECTPPTTMTRSLHSAIQPRVPTRAPERPDNLQGTTPIPKPDPGWPTAARALGSVRNHICVVQAAGAARERAGSDGEVQGRT